VAVMVNLLGPKLLMAVSASFLLIAIVAIVQLRRWAASQVNGPANQQVNQQAAGQAAEQATGQGITSNSTARGGDLREPAALGGSIWSGITDLLRSPYLLGICLFLLCYSLLSTFLYFQQVELLPQAITDSARRTQVLAWVDLAVNIATLLIQLLAFGTLIQRLGTPGMLVAMPVLSVLGFAAMAVSPVLATLLVFGALRRAGEYAISKPARETLFNVLPADQKYKAKNVIDTLVHRGGDTLSSWLFNLLKGLRLSTTDMSWLSAVIAVFWSLGALWLGRRAQQMAKRSIGR
jgi:ATP:ADP antiporter, AAA family